MGYVYKYTDVEGRTSGRAYALIDMGCGITIISDELARNAALQFGQMMQIRNPRGGISNVWSATANISIERTKHFERIEVAVAPRQLTGEEAVIGSDYINAIKGKVDIITAGLRCDYCDKVITTCQCTMRPFSRAGPGAPPQPGHPGTPPAGGPPQQWQRPPWGR